MMDKATNGKIPIIQEEDDNAEKRMILFYQLHRTDFLIKLLEISATEHPDFTKKDGGIFPSFRVLKLNPGQVEDMRNKLTVRRKELLNEIGIAI